MSIRKRIGKYIRDKSGVTALEGKIDYLTAYINLVGKEEIVMPDAFYAEALEEMTGSISLQDLNKVIHKNDLMFQFHLARTPDNTPWVFYNYFNVGLSATQSIERIVKEYEVKVDQILDFGSGYGRVSRFYSLFFPDADITVSEVKASAMEFQKNRLHFKTIVHGQEPSTFPDSGYDLIVALSVFSHLPLDVFQGWFEKLYKNLKPGGIAILSYNDISTCPFNHNGDYHFEHYSEDSYFFGIADRLKDTSNYGGTFISRSKLSAIVEKITNKHYFHERISGKQDALVLVK